MLGASVCWVRSFSPLRPIVNSWQYQLQKDMFFDTAYCSCTVSLFCINLKRNITKVCSYLQNPNCPNSRHQQCFLSCLGEWEGLHWIMDSCHLRHDQHKICYCCCIRSVICRVRVPSSDRWLSSKSSVVVTIQKTARSKSKDQKFSHRERNSYKMKLFFKTTIKKTLNREEKLSSTQS